MIIIDEAGDLTIQVLELEKVEEDEENISTERGAPVNRVEEFRVRKSTIMESSPVFNALLSPGRFAESTQQTVVLKGDHITSMEIMFRVLHDAPLQSTLDVPVKEMWPLVIATEKYDLDIAIFQEWFENWYRLTRMDLSKTSEAAKLLYPCWIFDHASAFASMTRLLAYESVGHIMEINPTKHFELHLPSRVIQQINAAKGRLRTILHTDLFKPNARLLSATCTCKEKTLFGYEKSLYELKVWPLEQVAQRHSIGEIVTKLKEFSFEAPESACTVCRINYDRLVQNSRMRVDSYFDGLCLDCMDKSKPKSGDTDGDYWEHNNLSESDFIEDCRIRHKQPTWYFSFMGRKEERERFRKNKRPYRGSGEWATWASGELPFRSR